MENKLASRVSTMVVIVFVLLLVSITTLIIVSEMSSKVNFSYKQSIFTVSDEIHTVSEIIGTDQENLLSGPYLDKQVTSCGKITEEQAKLINENHDYIIQEDCKKINDNIESSEH